MNKMSHLQSSIVLYSHHVYSFGMVRSPSPGRLDYSRPQRANYEVETLIQHLKTFDEKFAPAFPTLLAYEKGGLLDEFYEREKTGGRGSDRCSKP